MENNQVNNAAAAQAANPDLLAVVVATSACITALTAPVKTPAVFGAVITGLLSLFVALWVFTALGRGRRRRMFSLYLSFVALAVSIAAGGEFDSDILVKLYNAFVD